MRQMKDSGIEWIGKIPETWEVTKLLNVLKSPISDGPHETPSLVDNGIPFISVDSLNDSDKVDLSVVRKFISYQDYQEYSKKSKIEKGDILFSKAATIGKTAIVGDETFMVWSPLAIIKTNNNRVNNKFIYHVLNCHRLILYISFLGTYNTQINVGMRALERAIIPLPPLSNQHRIADYLDKKCGEIDSLIALQEQMIEKLKAYKQSVITEAVTKGLRACEARAAARADLQSARNEYKHLQCETDKADYKSSYSQRSDCKSDRTSADRASVKLVPSGIDWIGEIPEHWGMQRLKTLGWTQNGISQSGDYFGEDFAYPFVSYSDAYKNYSLPYPSGRANSSEKDRKTYSLIEGDVLFTRTSETIEEIGFSSTCLETIKGAVYSGFLIRFRPTSNKLYKGFSKYYFRSHVHRAYFVKQMNIVTRASLGQDLLKNLVVLLPPLAEQKNIATYLDEKCADIDRLIALKQQKIESLKDYKKSVIYEAVTGKTEI